MGTSLALWLVAEGAELAVVAGRAEPARDPRLPAAPWQPLAELSSAGLDLLLVTVSDPALAAVAAQLASRPQAAVVLHTSGPLDAEVLLPLRAASSAAGTLHPLRAFPAALAEPAAGTFYGLDGDPAALALGRRLATAWGGQTVEVAGARRTLYHLAATLAAGGVTTVFAAVAELLERAGLPRELLAADLHLMDGALEATRRAACERPPGPSSTARSPGRQPAATAPPWPASGRRWPRSPPSCCRWWPPCKTKLYAAAGVCAAKTRKTSLEAISCRREMPPFRNPERE